MSISDRLKQVLEKLKMNKSTFEAEIGVSNGTIGKIINNGTGFTIETFTKIIERFPELNGNWLVTGQGKMMKETNILSEPQAEYGKIILTKREYERMEQLIRLLENNNETHIKVIEVLTDSRNQLKQTP